MSDALPGSDYVAIAELDDADMRPRTQARAKRSCYVKLAVGRAVLATKAEESESLVVALVVTLVWASEPGRSARRKEGVVMSLSSRTGSQHLVVVRVLPSQERRVVLAVDDRRQAGSARPSLQNRAVVETRCNSLGRALGNHLVKVISIRGRFRHALPEFLALIQGPIACTRVVVVVDLARDVRTPPAADWSGQRRRNVGLARRRWSWGGGRRHGVGMRCLPSVIELLRDVLVASGVVGADRVDDSQRITGKLRLQANQVLALDVVPGRRRFGLVSHLDDVRSGRSRPLRCHPHGLLCAAASHHQHCNDRREPRHALTIADSVRVVVSNGGERIRPTFSRAA